MHWSNLQCIGEANAHCVNQVVAIAAEAIMLGLAESNDQVSWFLLGDLVAETFERENGLFAEAWLHLDCLLFIDANDGATIMLHLRVRVAEILERSLVELFESALESDDTVSRPLSLLLVGAFESVAKHGSSEVGATQVGFVSPGVSRVEDFVEDAFRRSFQEVAAASALASLHDALLQAVVAILVIDRAQLS